MDWLSESAATRPDAIALITSDRVVSYRELDQAANGVADIIVSSGAMGERAVGLWGDRSIETVAAVWGIPRAGVTAVPVDPRLPPATAMAATRSAGVGGLWTTPEGGFDGLLERGLRPGPGAPRPDVAYVVLTSGSEGTPKGVRLTDRNIGAAVAASRDRLGNDPADTWLCVLPLFHVAGLSILWRQAEAGGAVMLQESFEPVATAVALRTVELASLVPVMLRRILAADAEDWTGLRAVLVGGGAAAGPSLEMARRRGLPVVPTYGMTETCSQIATLAPGIPLDGSVGTAVAQAEIRVVVEGAPVVGAEGRVEVRGPMVSPGYVDEPDRPPEGWFATGDLGSIDSGGRLTIAGRADRVIVTGGENVHPALVERTLVNNPAIRAARVFGRPDADWGMRVVAEVETDAAVADLEAWAVQRMTPAMRPREWHLVERIAEKLEA